MSECTCTNPDHGRYMLVARLHVDELNVEVNRLLAMPITPPWKIHGPTFTFNLGYRQALARDADNRPWLLPHHAEPVSH